MAAPERVASHRLDPRRLGDHIDRLYRAAWAMCGSRQDAEDLVQETYARVLSRPRLVRGGDDLAYLLRVLRNTFLTRLRTQGRRPRTAPLSDGVEELESNDSLRPEVALETGHVLEAVSKLPRQFREVVIAVDLVGLSYDEAARALRTPTGTIRSRLFRARRALLPLLKS